MKAIIFGIFLFVLVSMKEVNHIKVMFTVLKNKETKLKQKEFFFEQNHDENSVHCIYCTTFEVIQYASNDIVSQTLENFYIYKDGTCINLEDSESDKKLQEDLHEVIELKFKIPSTQPNREGLDINTQEFVNIPKRNSKSVETPTGQVSYINVSVANVSNDEERMTPKFNAKDRHSNTVDKSSLEAPSCGSWKSFTYATNWKQLMSTNIYKKLTMEISWATGYFPENIVI